MLFSSDGKTLWQSKRRLAKARRNQCREWWNDEWRDRILATIAWLAGDEVLIRLPLGSDTFFSVHKIPLTFESSVSYRDPKEGSVSRSELDTMGGDYNEEDEDEEEDAEDADEEE